MNLMFETAGLMLANGCFRLSGIPGWDDSKQLRFPIRRLALGAHFRCVATFRPACLAEKRPLRSRCSSAFNLLNRLKSNESFFKIADDCRMVCRKLIHAFQLLAQAPAMPEGFIPEALHAPR
jgi:hypothetical protein